MPEFPRSIRIVIADDHLIFRDGLRRLLDLELGLSVVGETGSGDEAIPVVTAAEPDVLLLDLAMPRRSGWSVLQALAGAAPAVRPIVLSTDVDHAGAVRALQLGARAVILKEGATGTLCACIRGVMRGEYWVGRQRVTGVRSLLRSYQP
jgi:two-component system response regulator DegU